jgi:hypothetical protein
MTKNYTRRFYSAFLLLEVLERYLHRPYFMSGRLQISEFSQIGIQKKPLPAPVSDYVHLRVTQLSAWTASARAFSQGHCWIGPDTTSYAYAVGLLEGRYHSSTRHSLISTISTCAPSFSPMRLGCFLSCAR